MNNKKLLKFILFTLPLFFLSACSGTGTPQISAPGVTFSITPAGQPAQVSSGVQLLVLLTVLSLAPSILVMMTSFTRIVIVLSLLRNALGTPSVPPTQVLIGLALLLTFFTMAPIYTQINTDALQPYLNNQIDQNTALTKAGAPLRQFMFKQTRDKDLALFVSMSGQTTAPKTQDDIPLITLMPAFIISELRTAFIMGFVIYVPFLIIDLVVSSILLAMGMMMLPPSLISLPFKLLLFVMVDGWYLIAQSLVMSFK
jgi:flagellar biosynthesis protein FliP